MKYLMFLFTISCAPIPLDVKVTTSSGKCQSYAWAQLNKNTIVVQYFCGSEGNVFVEVQRLDK